VRALLREAAERDVEEAVAFLDALEEAILHVCRFPRSGSLRYAFELEIPELRSWKLPRFPHLLFYLPDDEHIDIWRILHAQRDIPRLLTDDPDSSGS
jgi:toxin ParE1/3/4